MAGRWERSRAYDRDLLQAACEGDRLAFGQLYRRYLSDVRDFCARRIADPIRAEDLAQDTFVRAFERIEEFRPDASFWPWISTIARNLCIDELRQRRRTAEEATAQPPEPAHLEFGEDATSDNAIAWQTNAVIRKRLTVAMEHLSERERDLIWQSIVQERSWESIARSNNTSIHAVRNAAWRARSVLRAVIGDSLRELRSWIAFPIAAAMASWRSLKRRFGPRSESFFAAVGNSMLERGAAVVMGLAVFAVPLLLMFGNHVSPKTLAAQPTPRGGLTRVAAPATSESPGRGLRVVVSHAHPFGSRVGTSVSLGRSTREHRSTVWTDNPRHSCLSPPPSGSSASGLSF